jgi:hypothetical protein
MCRSRYRGRDLQAVALRERAIGLSIDRHALQSTRIVGDHGAGGGVHGVHGELQMREHFLGFREVVIRSAGGVEFTERAMIIERACRFRAVWRTQQAATRSN